ncbi:hypothetical protein [Catenisphaera adipataccumulans]|uniref:Uncharacterized protein n=1 Tax=Catenisphaera adipataccumulans TaxID=700500 RepID=A0A7W8FVF2_9FIRM|nr:hypothetical protein [Catenisphaera adipataccumulans]MBB5182126.1 hypothetical protein [Catenisphaera adipataccumulans]
MLEKLRSYYNNLSPEARLLLTISIICIAGFFMYRIGVAIGIALKGNL